MRHRITNLYGGTTCRAQVRAVNEFGPGPWSGTATATGTLRRRSTTPAPEPRPQQRSTADYTANEGEGMVDIEIAISERPTEIVAAEFSTADGMASGRDSDFERAAVRTMFDPSDPNFSLVQTIRISILEDAETHDSGELGLDRCEQHCAPRRPP